MLLALDVGNSRTHLALYAGSVRVAEVRCPTLRTSRSGELGAALDGCLLESPIRSAMIRAVAVSSVVPSIDGALRSALRQRFGQEPLFIGRELQPRFPVRYDPPRSAGADRLANAAAALALCGGPAIVVDCGSAVNIDVVSPDGAFIGGAILPGPEAQRDALYRAAPHLPRVEIQSPERAIGGSSVACLQSGFYFGLLGQWEGVVRRIRTELGVEAPVIATGGWAESLLTGQPWVTRVEPDLTVEGVRRIWTDAQEERE